MLADAVRHLTTRDYSTQPIRAYQLRVWAARLLLCSAQLMRKVPCHGLTTLQQHTFTAAAAGLIAGKHSASTNRNASTRASALARLNQSPALIHIVPEISRQGKNCTDLSDYVSCRWAQQAL